MAEYLPPSENLPIFDDLVFQTNNEPLTYASASKYFLKYPTAQGTENLKDINVNGTANLNSDVNIAGKLTLTNTHTIYNSDGYVPNEILLSYNNFSDNAQFATGQLSQVQGFRNLCLGPGTSTNLLPGSDGNINVGVYSGNYITTGTNNVILGYQAGQSITTTSGNTIFGSFSGSYGTSVFGSNNTLLGSNVQITYDNCVRSTGIGSDAVITASNQIVLGTATETVIVPNRISFPNNSIVSTGPKFYNLSISSNTNLDGYEFDVTFLINATAGGLSVNINSPLTRANTSYTICNEGKFDFTLTCTGSIAFVGDYGSNTSNQIITSNTNVYIYSDGSNWVVYQRTGNITNEIAVTSNLVYTNNYSILDAILKFTSGTNASYTISLPLPSATESHGTFMQIFNNSIYYQTLSLGTGQFTQVYGSGASTIILPSNSWIKMYSNGTNWQCNERSDYGWEYPDFLPSNSAIPYGQIYRNYLSGVMTPAGYTLNFSNWAVPTYPLVGLTTSIKRIFGYNPSTTQYIMITSTSSSSTKAMYTPTYNTPITGAVQYLSSASSTLTLRASRVGYAGTGGTLGATTSGTTKIVNLAGTLGGLAGTLAYGSVLNISGSLYTIQGYNCFSTFNISANSGGTSNTNTLTIVGTLTVGCVFIVGSTEYTVVTLTNGATYTSANSMSIQPNGMTFTPGAGALWTTQPATNGASGYCGTHAGTYVVTPTPPVLSSGIDYTITNDVYAWCAI